MVDYQETLRRLSSPESWDVLGMISDAVEHCHEQGDEDIAAVIDWLCDLASERLEKLND